MWWKNTRYNTIPHIVEVLFYYYTPHISGYAESSEVSSHCYFGVGLPYLYLLCVQKKYPNHGGIVLRALHTYPGTKIPPHSLSPCCKNKPNYPTTIPYHRSIIQHNTPYHGGIVSYYTPNISGYAESLRWCALIVTSVLDNLIMEVLFYYYTPYISGYADKPPTLSDREIRCYHVLYTYPHIEILQTPSYWLSCVTPIVEVLCLLLHNIHIAVRRYLWCD
jgi:hypothetical protein